MKRKLFIAAGALALVGLIAGILVYFFVYNKPHKDYLKAEPEFTVEALALFEEFRADQAAASAMYNGKVIAVTGALTSVEQNDSFTVAVFEIDEGMFGSEGIRFTMLPESKDKIISQAPGTTLTIKGFCTGYNETDVILEHCSLVE
ncbi:hypothetical protein SDC9_24940 [bioreactor metagenome]|uniref:tRNA_anti-like protein n=1 Tax=bioreactor metagenome TaxID=1076179 RepID=A0A644UJB1_9ZZZZ|nr:hypothetical protein [Lentimicrobium sp.]MEA5109997.1 hypothetical protein [Lentimicrobium sp.]